MAPSPSHGMAGAAVPSHRRAPQASAFTTSVLQTNRLCEALADAISKPALEAEALAECATSAWLEARAACGALLESLEWGSPYAAAARDALDQLARELLCLFEAARGTYPERRWHFEQQAGRLRQLHSLAGYTLTLARSISRENSMKHQKRKTAIDGRRPVPSTSQAPRRDQRVRGNDQQRALNHLFRCPGGTVKSVAHELACTRAQARDVMSSLLAEGRVVRDVLRRKPITYGYFPSSSAR